MQWLEHLSSITEAKGLTPSWNSTIFPIIIALSSISKKHISINLGTWQCIQCHSIRPSYSTLPICVSYCINETSTIVNVITWLNEFILVFKSAHLKIRACHLIVKLQLKVVTATAMKTEGNIALSEIVYETGLFPINY